MPIFLYFKCSNFPARFLVYLGMLNNRTESVLRYSTFAFLERAPYKSRPILERVLLPNLGLIYREFCGTPVSRDRSEICLGYPTMAG